MLTQGLQQHVKQEQLTNRQRRIYDFLCSNPIGVLSMVSPNTTPHGAVVYFTVDKQFRVRFLTKNKTRKYDVLKRNGHVMLTVYDAVNQALVQLTGIASEVVESGVVNNVAAAIMGISPRTSESDLPPIVKLDAGDYTAFEIKPVEARMAVYGSAEPGSYDDLFESIESFELQWLG